MGEAGIVRVLVVDDSALIRQIVKESLESRGYVVTLVGSGEDALKQVEEHAFDLFVLDIVMPGMDGYQLCRRLRENPRTRALPILMLTSKSSVQEKVAGFEAGADDYMVKPFDPAELGARARALLERSTRTVEVPTPRVNGQLITCFSLRGGAGTTTLTVNLAVALAQLWQSQVAVADFSLERACVPLFLDVVPRVSMEHLVTLGADIASFEASVIHENMLSHPSGVRVLAAPQSPAISEQISSSLLGAMVQALQRHFPYVLCDTTSDFRENNLVLFDRADTIVLLTTSDIAGVKVTSTVLKILDALRVDRDKLCLVLNELTSRSRIGRKEVESTLGQPVAAVLPYGAERMVSALNAGVPIVLQEPEAPTSKAIQDLAFNLTERSDHASSTPGSSSLLARVRKRLHRETRAASCQAISHRPSAQ